MDGFKGRKRPNHETDRQGHYHLRNYRDIERTFGITAALKAAGVCQSDGDEEA